MRAFHGAAELGYRYIETDVRLTRDGHVIVFHDASLERTTNGRGKVSEWTLDALRRLDAAHMFGAEDGYPLRERGIGISSLAEVFAEFPEIHFNIDLKGPGMEWAVADTIKAARREETTLIGSFFDRRIAKFRRITDGTIATSAGPATALAMWLASRRGRSIPARVAAYQVPYDSKALPLDERYIAAIHEAGAQVHAWTVNSSDAMVQLLDNGVDGIVTDRPDLLNAVTAER